MEQCYNHWLPITKRISFKVLLMLYKSINGLAPDYISALATPYVPHRHLRPANNNLLFVPKTHYGDITFTVSAARMWNQLPTVIKLSGSVNIFKKNIKTYLFTQTLDYIISHVNHCLPVCVLCVCIYNHCFVLIELDISVIED